MTLESPTKLELERWITSLLVADGTIIVTGDEEEGKEEDDGDDKTDN
jgi:hypothetical protein